MNTDTVICKRAGNNPVVTETVAKQIITGNLFHNGFFNYLLEFPKTVTQVLILAIAYIASKLIKLSHEIVNKEIEKEY